MNMKRNLKMFKKILKHIATMIMDFQIVITKLNIILKFII
jgi:hypothetical protein